MPRDHGRAGPTADFCYSRVADFIGTRATGLSRISVDCYRLPDRWTARTRAIHSRDYIAAAVHTQHVPRTARSDRSVVFLAGRVLVVYLVHLVHEQICMNILYIAHPYGRGLNVPLRALN